MSYTVLYDSLGIRLPKSNTFLTLSKEGCSNVYDVYNNARARGWSFWTPLGCKPYTQDALVNELNNIRKSIIESNKKDIERYGNLNEYSDKSFGYFSSWSKYGRHTTGTSFKMVFNHYVKNKHIDFDDFVKHYKVYVELPYYCIPDELRDSVQPERVYVNSEDELLKTIEDFSCKYVGMPFYINVDIYSNVTSKEILQKVSPELLPTKKIAKPKEAVMLDKFYTITYGDYYFVKKTKRFIKYTSFTPAYKFATEKEAITRMKRLRIYRDDRFKIKLINSPTQIYV